MTHLIFQIALSNIFIALLLAFLALGVEITAKRPQLSHLLWVLVFVKLVTPPFVAVPVIPYASQPEPTAEIAYEGMASDRIFTVSGGLDSIPSGLTGVSDAFLTSKPLLASIWLLGSGIIFLGSLTRIYRFNRLLNGETDVAPQTLQTSARRIAHRLGLKTTPVIQTTAARLSPMVWWMGGKVRVIIPLSLINQIDTQETEWILAHELAHVRRRDYLVRWIEWLSCVCFWWNPLVWWARHRLRANEEICCDNLVLASFNPVPHTYATALLNAIEFLASPVIRPPAMASEINSGGYLERRFKMITSNTANRRITRWPQVCVLLLAMAILPVGLTFAGNREAAEKKGAREKQEVAKKKQSTEEYYRKTWKKLQAKVEAGEITQKEARAKMTAIKKKEQAKTKQAGAKKEAKSDEYYRKTWEKLQANVKAGKMTQKEARAKMSAIKKKDQPNDKQTGGKKEVGAKKEMKNEAKTLTREDYAKAETKLRKAVAEGKISKEEARRKSQWMRKQMQEQAERERGVRLRPISREEYARAEAHMKKRVETGEISKADMNKRLGEMRRMMAGENARTGGDRDVRRITQADYNRAETALFKAVENGRVSAENAHKRLAGMRKLMAMQSEKNSNTRGEKTITREDYTRTEANLKKAVSNGRISEADAKIRLKEMRKAMATQRKQAAHKQGEQKDR